MIKLCAKQIRSVTNFKYVKKVAFHTLGCKLNFSETSTIARKFQEKGFQRVDFQERPDIFIINTCSVTENADKKCKHIVKEAKKINKDSYIAIVGCYAQLKPKEIAEIPGVDAVFGAAEKFRLLELIPQFEKTSCTEIYASEINDANFYVSGYSLSDRTRSFLKVQDGCNYNCSFCTIPLARGKSRSGTIEEVVKSAEEIAQTEVREVVLTGVNIGDFGIVDGRRKFRFLDLIKELDKVENIDRFRISSIEPNLLDNSIIDFVASSKKFVPHFHIPLQSGSDILLKKMRRRYDQALYTERVDRIRKVMPSACIGVDVIVGFPGESEEEFLRTYNYLNDLDISYLHVFTYSERDNTPAKNLSEVVPLEVRKERSQMLRILSEKKRNAFYLKNIGEIRTVLMEQKEKDNKISGFTENYVRVSLPYDSNLTNKLIKVKLQEINRLGHVEAEPVEKSLLVTP